MCNLYRLHKSTDAIRQLFADQGLLLKFPEGAPNVEPRDIRITDRAPMVRMQDVGPALVERRWSWPSGYGKPLYNLRSEGRNFSHNRCLVVADGFYEFTKLKDPNQKRKDRWIFEPASGGLIGIAGIWRDHPDVGEAFTLLTVGPGEDVKPIHNRQIALIPPERWTDWLDPQVPSRELLAPSPPGFLTVESSPSF